MKKIYLCDGRDPNCPRTDCYKRGGNCSHTTKADHAKNIYSKFKKCEDYDGGIYYWEVRKLLFWEKLAVQFKRFFLKDKEV